MSNLYLGIVQVYRMLARNYTLVNRNLWLRVWISQKTDIHPAPYHPFTGEELQVKFLPNSGENSLKY